MTTTQAPRWRSSRRRSNEKSAGKIRRDTPPYWQIHTDGGPAPTQYPADQSLWIIHRVKEGYEVLVNGRPSSLPHTVNLRRDVVTLKETRTHRNSSGTTRSDLWKRFVRKGARVNYHTTEGGPPTHLNMLVLAEPFLVNGGRQWCTLIEGVRGWVEVELLTQAKG